jgi:zinc protease
MTGQNAPAMRFSAWVGLAVLVFSLCEGRAHAAEAALPETKLPNGLRVVLDENHRVPVVSVTVRYAVGAGADPDDRNGLSELVARMMAQRTQHVPENGFDDTFDRVGGTWGFDSNVDDTEFYARIPANALETAFWLFSDQMGFFKPIIDDASIAHQLQIFSADRGQRVANAPMGLVNELVPGELYPALHPYRHVARAGDAAGLASLTSAELGAFVDKYFVPSNAVMVVVGDAKLDQVTALANKWFGSIPAGAPPTPVSMPTPTLKNEIHLDIAARVERPVVRMTWLTPAEYAPGDAELDVVAGILHGNRIARLSWELITKLKVAGDISARQSSHRRSSTFVITATATPTHTAQQVADAIDDVLRTLQASQPPSEDDMEGSLASALMERTLSMESSEYRARQLAAWMIRAGTADYWQNDMHRYETDPARVQGAAQRYLPLDKRVVAFITPSATAPVSGQLIARKVK